MYHFLSTSCALRKLFIIWSDIPTCIGLCTPKYINFVSHQELLQLHFSIAACWNASNNLEKEAKGVQFFSKKLPHLLWPPGLIATSSKEGTGGSLMGGSIDSALCRARWTSHWYLLHLLVMLPGWIHDHGLRHGILRIGKCFVSWKPPFGLLQEVCQSGQWSVYFPSWAGKISPSTGI